MTLAILYGSSPFVFIARDRRVSWAEERDGSWTAVRGETEQARVYAHRDRAVIWALTGTTLINTDDRVATAISKIRGKLSTQIVPALVESLDVPIRRHIVAVEGAGYGDLLGRNVLGVFLGIHEAGSAGGIYLEFRKDGPIATSTMGHFTVTQHTKPFFDQLPAHELWPRNALHAIDHLPALGASAIAAAEKVAGGPADVGGPVDVAMVGPRGAQILPSRTRNSIGASLN